jgi:hypothetical protein
MYRKKYEHQQGKGKLIAGVAGVVGILPKCWCWTHLSSREWIKIPLQECFQADRKKPSLLEYIP